VPVGVAAEASDGTLIVCTQFWLPSALFLYTVHEVTTSSYFRIYGSRSGGEIRSARRSIHLVSHHRRFAKDRHRNPALHDRLELSWTLRPAAGRSPARLVGTFSFGFMPPPRRKWSIGPGIAWVRR